jgi:hypothetical protein
VPSADLGRPSGDRAPEPADLDGHLAIGEVTADLVDPLDRELGVGVVVDLAHDLIRVPREPHLLAGITSSQQTHERVVLIDRQPLTSDRASSPGSVSGSSRRPRWPIVSV